MAMVTNFFVGANSGEGFQNLFSEVVDLADTYDLMVLKGGPGVGKNTFMREIGRCMEAAGAPVEYLWCSGDPDSLDGVVLPSIRKNGGYIAGQEELSPQELMAKALLVAQKTLTDRDARIKELTAQNQIMQPKAEYFDELVARNLLTNFRETAKELGIKDKDFVGWLLEHKYIYRDQKNKLMPYAAKNNGLFEVKERTGRHNDWAGTQTFITPKGRETFRLLCKEPPVLPQFTAL